MRQRTLFFSVVPAPSAVNHSSAGGMNLRGLARPDSRWRNGGRECPPSFGEPPMEPMPMFCITRMDAVFSDLALVMAERINRTEQETSAEPGWQQREPLTQEISIWPRSHNGR